MSVVVLAVLVCAVVVGKVLADRSADAAASARAEQVAVLLDGSRPEEFLSLNAGATAAGSAPSRLAGAAEPESVVAGSQLAFLRFQPDGWWSAFAERCVVAEVRDSGVDVRVEKLACTRVAPP